jgi:hypothetical protein
MEMEEEGFTDITGIDYCQEAIALAEKVFSNNIGFREKINIVKESLIVHPAVVVIPSHS